MLLKDMSYSDPLASATFAKALIALRGTNPTPVLSGIFSPIWPTVQIVGTQPATTERTLTYYLGDAASAVILIDGITATAQGQAAYDGYLSKSLGTKDEPVNSAYFNAAFDIRNQMTTLGLRYKQNIWLVGYSFGGAVALNLLRMVREQNPNNAIRCVTFGSPRPGNAYLARTISQERVIRWMNDDDPVPLIPPRFADAPYMIFMLGPSDINKLGRYTQPRGGMVLKPNGDVVPDYISDASSLSIGASVAAFLYSQDTATGTAHGMDQYLIRLTNLYNKLQSAPFRTRASQSQEPVATVNRSAENNAEAQFVENIFNRGEAQNAPAIVQPKPVAFSCYRQGRVYIVAFGDVNVMIAPNKKRARAITRLGNEWLRRLQRQAYVDTTALINQFIGYIGEATDVTGNFVPPINNVMPSAAAP